MSLKKNKDIKGQLLHGHITFMFDSKNIFMGTYCALALSLHPISDGVSIKWKETKSKMGAINIEVKIKIEILL